MELNEEQEKIIDEWDKESDVLFTRFDLVNFANEILSTRSPSPTGQGISEEMVKQWNTYAEYFVTHGEILYLDWQGFKKAVQSFKSLPLDAESEAKRYNEIRAKILQEMAADHDRWRGCTTTEKVAYIDVEAMRCFLSPRIGKEGE